MVVVRSVPSEVSARARSVCRVASSSRNENIASRSLRVQHVQRAKAVVPTISAAPSPRSSPISIPVRRTMPVEECRQRLPYVAVIVIILLLLVIIVALAFGNRGAASTQDVAKVPITGVSH